MSLLSRIQNRINANSITKDVLQQFPRISTSEDFHQIESESESDIDDDVTLEECATIATQKNDVETFTKVKHKSPTLKDVLSQKIVDLTERQLVEGLDRRKENHTVSISKGLSNYVVKNVIDTKTISNKTLSDSDYGADNVSHKNMQINTNINMGFKENCIVNEPIKIDEGNILANDVSLAVKRKRTKLTAEERQAAKEQKEREKLEKKKQREKAKLEKELEKEREKALKRATVMNSRSERKDDCMQKMLCIMDPKLVEDGGADILKSLQDISARYELKSLPLPNAIGWMKENIDYNVDEHSQLTKTSSYSDEDHILYKMAAEELAKRINAQLKGLEEENTLNHLLKELRRIYPNKKYTIVVIGVSAYYRRVKTKKDQMYRKNILENNEMEAPAKKKRKANKNEIILLSKDEIEEVLAELQLTTNISVRFCEDSKEFSLFVMGFTRSIGEAPFKKNYDSALQFCSNGPSDKSCVKIGNDGYGLLQLWNQQLQQFYGVRHDTACAITQVYPTPLSLVKAYETLSESEGKKLLQDIEVRRGVGVLQTQRRVGIELSKRLYKLMTSVDGNEEVAR